MQTEKNRHEKIHKLDSLARKQIHIQKEVESLQIRQAQLKKQLFWMDVASVLAVAVIALILLRTLRRTRGKRR